MSQEIDQEHDKNEITFWNLAKNTLKPIKTPDIVDSLVYLGDDKYLIGVHYHKMDPKPSVGLIRDRDEIFEFDLRTLKWRTVGPYRYTWCSCKSKMDYFRRTHKCVSEVNGEVRVS